MLHYLHFSDGKPQAVRQSTNQDGVLQAVKQIILVKHLLLVIWPALETTPDQQVRNELCAQDGIWFKAF